MRPPRPLQSRVRRPQPRWWDWGLLLLGAWLFISPWVLNTFYQVGRGPFGRLYLYPGASPGDFWWVGGALFVLAAWSLTAPWARWTEWIAAALAIWLFISPWVLGFAYVPRAAWNAWGVAILVWILAWAALPYVPRRPMRRLPLRRVPRRRRRDDHVHAE